MKRKLKVGLAAIVVAAAAMGALAGCDFDWTVTFSWTSNVPYALVKDEAGAPIVGATVTLAGASTFSVTTDSTGKASFTGFDGTDVGDYTLSASAAGYTFYVTSVTVGETSIYLGTLIGYVPAVTTSTVTGTVTDARLTTASGIAGVTVKLFAAGATTELATATTDTSGAFTFDEVDPGRYKLTAAKTGFAFIDRAFDLTQIGATVDVGAVLGFTSSGSEIAIIAVWGAAFSDVDSYLTFPSGDKWTTNPSLTGLDPYSGADAVTGQTTGFFPGTTAFDPLKTPTQNITDRGRDTVYYGDKESAATYAWFYGGTDTRPAVKLDRDDLDGSGPETVTIIAPPVYAAVGTTTLTTTGSATANGLPTGTYAWLGVMEYYVDSYGTPSLSTEGSSGGANVEVYVIQGSTVKGRFVVPDYIAIEKASVLRINFFLNSSDQPVYQFLPDVRIADYGGVRSIAATAAPLVLFGDAR